MKHLIEFVEEQKKELDRFEKWWFEQNEKDPDNFPLTFDDDNEGMWFEQFTLFDSGEE